MSWEIHFGPIPNGQEVYRTCGNVWCVAPHHLKCGTHAEALRHAFKLHGHPGRHGEDNHSAILTSEQVAQIRNLAARGMKPRQLEDIFPAANSTIRAIIAGRRRRFG